MILTFDEFYKLYSFNSIFFLKTESRTIEFKL